MIGWLSAVERTIFSQRRLNSMILGVSTTLGVPGQSIMTDGSFYTPATTGDQQHHHSNPLDQLHSDGLKVRVDE